MQDNEKCGSAPDRISDEVLRALAARGNIKPDNSINQGTLDAAAAAPALADEVLELRELVGEIAPAMAVMQSEVKAAFDELDLMRKRLHAMHRRAQKSEGRLSRIMEILERGERWFHRYGEQNKITPAMIPRFYVLEAIKQARRK